MWRWWSNDTKVLAGVVDGAAGGGDGGDGGV